MNKRLAMVLAALLLIGALFVAACGGDDDDDAGGDGGAATATEDNSQPTETDDGSEPTATGSGGEPTNAATQPASGGIEASDACDLLTKSEVEDALGEAVQEPTALDVLEAPVGGGTAAVGGCGFTSESFASSISITYWYAPGLDEGIRAMIDLACGQGQESISGLGDRACWYDEQRVQIQLAKDGYFIDMFATMSGDASDVLLTLAEKAVEKLS